jgi:hypothetical protein
LVDKGKPKISLELVSTDDEVYESDRPLMSRKKRSPSHREDTKAIAPPLIKKKAIVPYREDKRFCTIFLKPDLDILIPSIFPISPSP